MFVQVGFLKVSDLGSFLALDAEMKAKAEVEAELDVLERITCCFPVGMRFSCRVK